MKGKSRHGTVRAALTAALALAGVLHAAEPWQDARR